jgi:hypothetical protein
VCVCVCVCVRVACAAVGPVRRDVQAELARHGAPPCAAAACGARAVGRAHPPSAYLVRSSLPLTPLAPRRAQPYTLRIMNHTGDMVRRCATLWRQACGAARARMQHRLSTLRSRVFATGGGAGVHRRHAGGQAVPGRGRQRDQGLQRQLRKVRPPLCVCRVRTRKPCSRLAPPARLGETRARAQAPHPLVRATARAGRNDARSCTRTHPWRRAPATARGTHSRTLAVTPSLLETRATKSSSSRCRAACAKPRTASPTSRRRRRRARPVRAASALTHAVASFCVGPYRPAARAVGGTTRAPALRATAARHHHQPRRTPGTPAARALAHLHDAAALTRVTSVCALVPKTFFFFSCTCRRR